MNEIIIKETDIEFVPNKNSLSPRDPQYALSFFYESLKGKIAQADAFVENIYNVVLKESSTATQIVQGLKKGSRYVVDMTESTKKAIDNGQIKLVSEHGKLRAQLLDSKGHYSTKLDIKEEFFSQGIDPVQMSNALQMKALQEQLKEIANQIVMINSSVIDVLQGQQNDRIALFYSGVNLYLEAQSVNNPEMKNALLAQSIRALSDGTQQLALTMESDIEYLTSKQYNKIKGKKVEAIQGKMDGINKAFGFIHQATLARAAIYCEQNEYLAMANVLDEYSRFIDNVVVNNANLLSQCDLSDDGTEKGIWKTRANLRLDASEFKKSLATSNNTYYLSIEDDSDED